MNTDNTYKWLIPALIFTSTFTLALAQSETEQKPNKSYTRYDYEQIYSTNH
jgi:hypothetical protein